MMPLRILKAACVVTFAAVLLLSSQEGVTALSSSSSTGMKRVLVTGGNKGIGKAICKKILESQPDVCVIIGSRDLKLGEKAVADLTVEVPNSADRIKLVQLDVTNDASVKAAAESIGEGDQKLYAMVNNAGIGFGRGFDQTVNTNYFGCRRVCDAFADVLVRPGGRVVNIASAAGPNFVVKCQMQDLRNMLAEPLTISGIDQLDDIAKKNYGMIDYEDSAYGLSKALLNAYTVLYAKENPDLTVNSCSPGWIKTDLTAGMGATGSPEQGTLSPVHLLFSPEMETIPTGRYYGSDAVRSPLDRYRGPGEPAFAPEDDSNLKTSSSVGS